MFRPATLALICAAACGCRSEESPGDRAPRFEVEANPNDPFGALVDVVFDQAVAVHAEVAIDGELGHPTPTVHLDADQPTTLVIRGLQADGEVAIRVVAEGGEGRFVSEPVAFHSGPLPDGFPELEVASSGPFDPDELVCTNGFRSSGPTGVRLWFCVDREGVPRISVEHPEGLDLLVVRPTQDGGFAAVNDTQEPKLSLFDPTGALSEEILPSWVDERGRFRHSWIDGHDVLVIREGPWAGAVALLTGSADDTPSGPRLGYGIAVIDPAEMQVLWDWSSHGALGDGQPIDPKLPYDRDHPIEGAADWQHANALVHGLDPDGGQFFWMSLRHQDWVIKIDVETDEVVWRFGDGGDFELVDDIDAASPQPLPPDLWQFHQHSVDLVARDGDRIELVAFDNGNLRRGPDGSWDTTSAPYSRLAAFELDERTMLASPTRTVGGPGEFFSLIRGDADVLPDDRLQYLVSYPGRPFVATVDGATGEEIWRMTLPESSGSYRAPTWSGVYATRFE